MILRRIGNKSKIAHRIQEYFPSHEIYLEPFFGAGGMFFNKPKAKYNIVNDIDDDVVNLFQIVLNRKDELIELFTMMPVHETLLRFWMVNTETDPMKSALRFLFLSNFTLYGKQDTIYYGQRNSKLIGIENISKTFEFIKDVQFYCGDFRKFFVVVNNVDRDKTFVYADPPYLNTVHTYKMDDWTEQDYIDLLDTMVNFGSRFAMSEFDNPFILEQAKTRGLYVNVIGNRRSLENRNTEILITNYRQTKTFGFTQL
jgi:DNA adenine methylase